MHRARGVAASQDVRFLLYSLLRPSPPVPPLDVPPLDSLPDEGDGPAPVIASPPHQRPAAVRMAGRLGRALRHRNYRLFFAGQGISVIGTWLTRFATSWMAYRLTGSALVLGLVAFFGQAPT